MRTITCFGDRTSGTFQIIASVSRTKITRFHGPMTLWMRMFSTVLHLLIYSLTGNRNFARKEELIYETIAALTSNSSHLETSSHFHIPLIVCSLLFPAMQYQILFSLFNTFPHFRNFKKVRPPWSHYHCSKAILRSAELPFLCNLVFFLFSTFCSSFRHGRIYVHYRINKQRGTSFQFSSSILSTVDLSKHLIMAWIIRKFTQLVNFVTFSIFSFFFGNWVWLNPGWEGGT